MANLHYHDSDVNHQSIQDVLLPFNTMTEISIFLLFGLLIHPSDLAPCISAGLAAAAALMLIARPISVICFQHVSPFNRKESAVIAWCGLRGAVPLALSFSVQEAIATYPGLEKQAAVQLAQNAQGIIFIVVILNLLIQGISIAPLCRALNAPTRPASFG